VSSLVPNISLLSVAKGESNRIGEIYLVASMHFPEDALLSNFPLHRKPWTIGFRKVDDPGGISRPKRLCGAKAHLDPGNEAEGAQKSAVIEVHQAALSFKPIHLARVHTKLHEWTHKRTDLFKV
jgi:hypothetical protein